MMIESHILKMYSYHSHEICQNQCGYCTFRKGPESFHTTILMEVAKVQYT